MHIFSTGRRVVLTLCLMLGGLGFLAAPAHAQHSADTDDSFSLSLSELLRLIQLYNIGSLHCDAGTEDGYAPGGGDQTCASHDSDYLPQNWTLSLSELLRAIQIYNANGGYTACVEGEDGFCPIFLVPEGEGEGEGEGGSEGEGEGEGEGAPDGFVVITLGNSTAIPGEDVLLTFDITVQDAAPSVLQFDLNYNDILLDYSGAAGGSAVQTGNRIFTATELGNGKLRMTVTNPQNSTLPIESGDFASVALTVSEEAEFGQSFTLFGSGGTCTGTAAETVDFSVSTGSILMFSDDPIPPRAKFSANPRVALLNTAVTFTNASFQGTGTGATYLWQFGDGETSTDENPVHFYDTVGDYTVTLTTTTTDGSDNEVKIGYIKAIDGKLIYVNKGNVSGTEDGFTWATAYNTIQEGINAVSTAGGGEVWVKAGTYNEARGGTSGTLLMQAVVSLYGGFAGTETELEQRDPAANVTVIDGSVARNGVAAIHVVTNANNTTIDGFTIRGGRATTSGSSTNQQGGGLFNLGVNTSIANCTFTDNDARTAGGAIFTAGGSLILSNCTFTDNNVSTAAGNNQAAPAYGGAVYLSDALLTASSCTFTDNSATGAATWTTGPKIESQALGGAVAIFSSTATIHESSFLDNTALATGTGSGNFDAQQVAAAPSALGGAIYVRAGSVSVRDCVVGNNTTQTTGNNGFAQSSGSGILSAGAGLTLANTIVYDNNNVNPAADPAGTGVTVDNTIATRTVVITGCTIAGNNSTSSDLSEIGGIYALNASPVVTNTIVYGNVGNSIVASGGTVVTTYSNIQDGFAGEGNLNVDPLFVNAAGGDFHLQSGSPCIDRGRDTSGAIYGGVSTDFEGDARGFDGPGLEPEQAARYDIGADEYTD